MTIKKNNKENKEEQNKEEQNKEEFVGNQIIEEFQDIENLFGNHISIKEDIDSLLKKDITLRFQLINKSFKEHIFFDMQQLLYETIFKEPYVEIVKKNIIQEEPLFEEDRNLLEKEIQDIQSTLDLLTENVQQYLLNL